VSAVDSLLENPDQRVPRGLKPARDDKNKGQGTAQLKLRPFKATRDRVVLQIAQPDAEQDAEAQAQ